MPTQKRQRQRAAQRSRQEAAEAARRRSAQRRRLVGVAVLVGLVALSVVAVALGGGDDETEVSSGGSGAPGAGRCPAAEGSVPRKTSFDRPPPMCIDPTKEYRARFETTKGSFVVTLDPAKAPKTVNNFVVLARFHFYDGIAFHRIIPGFVVQGGDPEGTGSGGPGYTIEDELPRPGEYRLGAVAMANTSRPDTGGSQFFIITGEQGVALAPNYSLFGRVTSGMDVVKAIEAVGTPAGTPSEEVRMRSVTIQEA